MIFLGVVVGGLSKSYIQASNQPYGHYGEQIRHSAHEMEQLKTL